VNLLSTLPTTGEQARRALLLLGAPAPARLVVDVHAAFFDGDLSMAALAGLARSGDVVCAALRTDLTAVPGMVALASWSLEQRIRTPARRRADELSMVARVAELGAASPGRRALVRELAQRVPDGMEALDLTAAARAALTALGDQLAREAPAWEAAVARARELDARQQLFGLPVVPHQRERG
jgi:hypothetical protein